MTKRTYLDYAGLKAYHNLLSTRIAPTRETATIAVADWQELSGASPFTHYADVTATYTIGTNTNVKLENNDVVLFANYGFAVASVTGQSLRIYSIGKPTDSATLTISFKEE